MTCRNIRFRLEIMHNHYWITPVRRQDIARLVTSANEKLTKDEQVQTDDQKRLTIQKSLEILEITDLPEHGLEISFEKPNFTESEHENYRTPNETFLEPLNEAVAEQIDQLIAKLNDCANE